MLGTDSPTAAAVLPSAPAEAARYALLRRRAPSMRHHLVVNLQPIGMVYEVMDRRLRAAQPDLASIQESAGKINGFARAALDSCIDVVGWLAQDEKVATPVQEGVRECTSLLATSLSFRGYGLRNEVAAMPAQVRRSALRNLLTGLLVHVTDHVKPPADLVLTAEEGERQVVLLLAVRATEGDKGFANEAAYRRIEWSDLVALAEAEDVGLERVGQGYRLLLPMA